MKYYILDLKTDVEYKSSNKEIKKVYEKCNLVVGFDETFKDDNHIVSCIEGKWNDWLDG